MMMKIRQLDKTGDSIECLEAQCQMRDPYKPTHHPNDPDGLPYHRAIGRAAAEITEELGEKARRICPEARTQKGKKITGQRIVVRSQEGFTRDALIQGSKRHKAQVFSTQGHTVATVKYPFQHVQAILARQANPLRSSMSRPSFLARVTSSCAPP